MKDKSKLKLRILLIAIGMFAGHFAMDIFKIGAKDGASTAHAALKSK